MKRFLLLLCLVAPSLCSAENLFKNSTMEPKAPGWDGPKKFVSVEGNSALLLEAKKNRPIIITQDVDTRKKSKIFIKLRYRTKEYEGEGLTVRVTRSVGGITYATFPLNKTNTWENIEWDFPEFKDVWQLQISLELLPGSGGVLIDDVTLDAVK